MKYMIVDCSYEYIKKNKGDVLELHKIEERDLFISKDTTGKNGYFTVGRKNKHHKDGYNISGLASFNALVHAEIFCKALIEDLANDPICPMFGCDNKKVIHYCEQHVDRED